MDEPNRVTVVSAHAGGGICGDGPHALRHIHVEPRWCFACRRRTLYRIEVWSSIHPSYWGPFGQRICSGCGALDQDIGFGRVWEYDGW